MHVLADILEVTEIPNNSLIVKPMALMNIDLIPELCGHTTLLEIVFTGQWKRDSGITVHYD